MERSNRAIVRARYCRLLSAVMMATISTACGAGDAATPTAPSNPTAAAATLDRVAVIAALDYWQSVAGITYQLIDGSAEPRVLIRLGTDGLASEGGGRGLIDGTYPNNQARSGLVVVEPGGGQYCTVSPAWCRYLYRHEIGHAYGFIGHSAAGLMNATPDVLTERERRMVVALYSLPHGAQVESDGRWQVPSTGASGRLDDMQAAQDLIDWNMNGVSSYRREGVITRWQLPVQIYLQQ